MEKNDLILYQYVKYFNLERRPHAVLETSKCWHFASGCWVHGKKNEQKVQFQPTGYEKKNVGTHPYETRRKTVIGMQSRTHSRSNGAVSQKVLWETPRRILHGWRRICNQRRPRLYSISLSQMFCRGLQNKIQNSLT